MERHTEATVQVVCGINPVAVLLERAPGKVVGVYVDGSFKNRRVRAIVNQAMTLGVRVHALSREDLEALAPGEHHQGVVARQEHDAAVSALGLEDLLTNLSRSTLLLILDGVQDPHNLGACLRSADAAGVDAVIVPRDKSCAVTPAVHRASAGASHTVPLYRVANLARVLKRLKEGGMWLVGADATSGQSLYDTDLGGSVALVLGGEGKGLRRLTREACDYLVQIPMRGAVPSLNVSVASAVMLFEALRQRRFNANTDVGYDPETTPE